MPVKKNKIKSHNKNYFTMLPGSSELCEQITLFENGERAQFPNFYEIPTDNNYTVQ